MSERSILDVFARIRQLFVVPVAFLIKYHISSQYEDLSSSSTSIVVHRFLVLGHVMMLDVFNLHFKIFFNTKTKIKLKHSLS